jgi:hypothetical protein
VSGFRVQRNRHFPEKLRWRSSSCRVASSSGWSELPFNLATGRTGPTASVVYRRPDPDSIHVEIQRLQVAKAPWDGGPTSKPAAKPSAKTGRQKMSAAGRARIVSARTLWTMAKLKKVVQDPKCDH